jgi:hypothetical protein
MEAVLDSKLRTGISQSILSEIEEITESIVCSAAELDNNNNNKT